MAMIFFINIREQVTDVFQYLLISSSPFHACFTFGDEKVCYTVHVHVCTTVIYKWVCRVNNWELVLFSVKEKTSWKYCKSQANRLKKIDERENVRQWDLFKLFLWL